MSKFGVKVSRRDRDATSDDIRDFVFDSNVEVLKTIQSGSVNLNISGGEGSVDVYHGLGRDPSFMVYYGDGSRYFINFPNTEFSAGRELTNVVIGAKADTVKLTILGEGTNGDYAVYYEIFEQGGFR